MFSTLQYYKYSVLIIAFLISMPTVFFTVQKAEIVGYIIIDIDGTIVPSNAPILRNVNVYTFSSNIFCGIIIKRSNIVVNGNGYFLQGSSSGKGLYLEGVSNVTVHDLKIRFFEFAIYLERSFNNTIFRNDVVDCYNGISLHDSYNNTIFGNYIKNIFLRGIELYSSSKNTISKNNMSQIFRGMWVSGSDNNTIVKNTIAYNDYEGICLYHSGFNLISENTIKKSNYDGIVLYYYSNFNTISKNNISDCYNGVHLDNSIDNIIFKNTIADTYRGVYLYSSSANTVYGNNIAKCYFGIYLYASHNIVSSNKLAYNEEGIALYNSFNNTIFRNDVVDCYNGISLHDSYNNTISKNTMSNSRYEGICLYHSGFNLISENTIKKSNYDGIVLYYYSNFNTISKNNISENNYDGMYLYCCYNNTVSENTLVNNFRGVFFWNSSNGIISGNLIINSKYDGICVHGAYVNIIGNNISKSGYYGIGLHSAYSIIFGNTITNSGHYGIHIYDSVNLKIFNNNFLNNSNQIRLTRSSCELDNGYPSGGNYWSDYYVEDNNNDGLGDVPYTIGDNFQDVYPVIAPIYVFKVNAMNVDYYISVVSTAKISDFYFNIADKLIRFKLANSDGKTDFCRVSIPKGLIGALNFIVVKIGGQIITPDVMEDFDTIYLYFNCNHTTDIMSVEIFCREMKQGEAAQGFEIYIFILAVVAFLSIVLAVVVFYKRKFASKSQERSFLHKNPFKLIIFSY